MSLFLLFLPPVVPCFLWYKIEFEENPLFKTNFELKGAENINREEVDRVFELVDYFYESTKDDSLVKFGEQKSDLENNNFEKEVSRGITEKLGVFSFLPYHKVCLVNKNVVYINGIVDEDQASNVAINQLDGYNFFTEKGSKDCKNVLINRFRQNSSSPEFTYPILVNIDDIENKKRLEGKNYIANLATTSIGMMDTVTTISLCWWVVALAYLLLLFAWSFIFFQYRKILKFTKLIE